MAQRIIFGFATLGVVIAFAIAVAVSTATAVEAFHVQTLKKSVPVMKKKLHMIATTGETKKTPPPKKKGYEPKWKKTATLTEKEGPKDFVDVGLKGTIPVVFQQGTERKTTVALPGQPLREVAIQAGQFIKYGCGKGECGTCECLVNGQWIRPCSVNVPAFLENGITEYLVQVKEVKNKASSSGKFYSVRSFLWGFYNNVLGMVGLVAYRKAAKKNYNERMEYERLVKEKTAEKKRLKLLQQEQQSTKLNP